MPNRPEAHRSKRSRDSRAWHSAQAQTCPLQRSREVSRSSPMAAAADTKRQDGISSSARLDENPISETIEDLRKKMETALKLQTTRPRDASSPNSFSTALSGIAQRRTDAELQSSDESVQALNSQSSESSKTIKGGDNGMSGTVRTPSFPFPRMALRLSRGHSHLSGPLHKPFTLLSPTNGPYTGDSQANLGETLYSHQDDAASRLQPRSPSLKEEPPDDPNYPPPDLYDLVLLLNAEPGLDSWWTNVTEILAEAYGAERASLAVPGDMTDLENVPWGQKATFNLLGVDRSDSSAPPSAIPSEAASARAPDYLHTQQASDPPRHAKSATQSRTNIRRPHLESRHSIAGMVPDSLGRELGKRPAMPTRAISGRMEMVVQNPLPAVEDLASASNAISEADRVSGGTIGRSSGSMSVGTKPVVHPVLHALESEPYPLIVRTGVAALLGKRKPVVMTRSLADSSTNGTYPIFQGRYKASDASARHNRHPQAPQPQACDTTSKLLSSHRPRLSQGYAEFEQPEPSPWSNSPRPSPAARADPAESPFFQNAAHVDEAAFNPDSSAYDYSASRPVEAIGIDSAKTIIHIPLIQPVPSRRPRSSSVRFPIAIISILTSITPYPLSLRHSLTALQPHLASSYSLAHQFTSLEAYTQGRSVNRYGQILGLGGTFSDEGSELELVAELSGQMARISAEEPRRSTHGSMVSPGERSPIFRTSPVGTPFSESGSTGFTPGCPTTPGISGADLVDNYFSVKRQKPTATPQHLPTTPGGTTLSKLRQLSVEDTAARSKNHTPSLNRQTSPRIHTSSSSRSSSSLSFSRPEIVSELSRRRLTRLESLDLEIPALVGPRNYPTASQGGTASREVNDRSLPQSVSQLLLNSVPLQLFLAKPRTGELIWTNSKFDAFRTQAQPEGSRTKDPWQNTHPDDRQTLFKNWNQVLKTGAQMTQHVRVKRFSDDSDYRWFIFRANPLLAPTGQLTYWIGSFLDVHDQHVSEMKAAEERDTLLRNARYQALANSIPQILFEAVENVGIVSTNEQWHIFSGQSLDEALSLGFTKHVHRDDLENCGIVAAIQNLAATTSDLSGSSESSHNTVLPRRPSIRGREDVLSLTNLVRKGIVTIEQDENGRISYSTEIRLRSRGGEFRWFLVRLLKVDSDLLNVGRTSWYGTCTDIHDRRALEEELSRVNQRMQLEMESKTKFFANMSHEIRTPLNGILGSIPWLMELDLEPDQRRTIDTIQNSSNNLRELVDNILDVTKVEAGKMTLAPKWFHIRTLVEEVIDTVASRAIDKGLQLNYTLDANVPPIVKGDPFRLRQILINLVGNAVKFTDVGEVFTRCYVSERSEGDGSEPETARLTFEVIDTGRGFSRLEFQRLFKQFGQTGGSSSHDAGSGLGLFLSRQLVELLGGQLVATSEVDQGSTFSFYIQVGTPPGDASKPAANDWSASQRPSMSDTPQLSSAAGREFKTALTSRGFVQSPGLSKLVASPDVQSPAPASSCSSNPSLRSFSGHQTDRSSMSSVLPTPEQAKFEPSLSRQHSRTSERLALAEGAMETSSTAGQYASSEDDQSVNSDLRRTMHPTTYSIAVLCTGQYARGAIKQHIEMVVPHQIAVNVTTIDRMDKFYELMDGATMPVFTHVVLDLPISHDLVQFMRRMLDLKTAVIPTLVIITDHYQKRDVADEHAALTKAGRVAYMIQKPVKPCVFSLIFDPAQQRKLSRDRNRDMAQSVKEDFKNVAERVKRTLSGKGHRILLVEDSEVNRMVVLRYLKKIDVASDYAVHGQECLDMLMSKQPGYYTLILCDIQMPIKNGYETCQELRQWEVSHGLSPLPVMALTANAMPEERAAAAKAGFTDYLTKPIEYNKLGTMLVALLDPKKPHVFLSDRKDRD